MSLLTSLSLQSLQLNVHLGWTDEERAKSQIVLLDVTITFSVPPKACESDQLNETVCYADLVLSLERFLKDKSFHLIEHLSWQVFHFIQSQIPITAALSLAFTKHPPIPGLGSVHFTCDGTGFRK